MDNKGNIRTDMIVDLLTRFCKKAYSISSSNMSDEIYLDKCIELWKLDYYCEIMHNDENVCDSYPSRIVIPLFELGPSGSIIEESCPILDVHVKTSSSFSAVASGCSSSVSSQRTVSSDSYAKTVKEYLRGAAVARCRNRAPVPAILCKKKYICRSGTLSAKADIFRKHIIEQAVGLSAAVKEEQEEARSFNLDTAREIDIQLLKLLNISTILDLMVENKKTKYGLSVSSSEKIDKNCRYSDFKIAVLPYPGCEFYRKFFDNRLQSQGLFHDWTDPINDADLTVSSDVLNDPIPSKVTDDWENYRHWDINQMSKHYLKLALLYLLDKESKESGLLVHCISGWDRTPLLTCLIRLSLWADGIVHPSLDAKQMLFFVLAYDWYLFGHQLPDRLKYGEFILCFCFEFLEEILDDSYSMIERSIDRELCYYTMADTKKYCFEDKGNDPHSVFNRRTRLLEVRRRFFTLFSSVYDPTKIGPTNASDIFPEAFNRFL